MKIKLKNIKDQVIVITGASGGIGQVTARLAARKGARVVLVARNEDGLQKLAEEINKEGGIAMYVHADVGKENDVVRIAQSTIRTFGGFDTWVNNAGVSIFGGCLEVPVEDMKRMFDTNFWGVVYGSRVAVEHFKENSMHGAVVNVGSFLGDLSSTVQPTFSPSKHAAQAWTDALRTELEKEKTPISISLVHAAKTDTPYVAKSQNNFEQKPTYYGYKIAPEVVAEAILYCAVRPKREFHIGMPSKILSVLGGISPMLTSRFLDAVHSSEKLNKKETPNNLNSPGVNMKRRKDRGLVRKSSLLTEVSKRPVLSSILFAGLGAGMWMLTKRKTRS